MKDPFEHDFDQGLVDVQAVLGAKFQVPPGGTSYEAISIDKLQMEERAMPGGKFQDVNTTIIVRAKIAIGAGIKDGVKLSAYGENLRVVGIEKDGDDSWTVFCGPTGVEVPRLRV